MDNHKCQTYGEQFDDALACETTAQAELWMEKEVDHLVTYHGKNQTEAISIIKQNIGYMAGYYSQKESEKIYRLFHAEHPIFGKPDYRTRITPKEAFEAGKRMGLRKVED